MQFDKIQNKKNIFTSTMKHLKTAFRKNCIKSSYFNCNFAIRNCTTWIGMIYEAGNFQTRTWENRSISQSWAFEIAIGIGIAIVQWAATLHRWPTANVPWDHRDCKYHKWFLWKMCNFTLSINIGKMKSFQFCNDAHCLFCVRISAQLWKILYCTYFIFCWIVVVVFYFIE